MDAEMYYLCERSRKCHGLDQTAPLTHLHLDYPLHSKALAAIREQAMADFKAAWGA
jgi:hypothetical protein